MPSPRLFLFVAAGAGCLLFATGIVVGQGPSFQMTVLAPSNGLRVQTDQAGGTLASFGGNGTFQIDAPGIPKGRFVVTEPGNVGIGVPSPAARLSVAGTVESTSGGFKFPMARFRTVR